MSTPLITGMPPGKARFHCVTGLQMFIGFCLVLGLSLEAFAQTHTLHLPSSVGIPMTGTSATLLPDGQWLLLGGESHTGPVATAWLYDPVQQKLQALAMGLLHARAYHTATLLADGQVLVLGGAGEGGFPVADAELFNPEKATFQALHHLGLMARTRHGATLLVDGRLLITGGSDARGRALPEAELLNPFSQNVERFNARLEKARLSHLASLLPNHHVLIWGGVDSTGSLVAGAELYDPQTQQFVPYDALAVQLALAELNSPKPPVVVDSEPDNGETHVRVDKLLSVRFSKPLAVTSLNPETVVLFGPDGQVPTRVTPTEGGLVTFILPTQELLPSADYVLIMQDIVDLREQPLALVSIHFKTQALGQQAQLGKNAGPSPTTGAQSASPSSRPNTPGDQARPSGTAGDTTSKGITGIGSTLRTDGEQEETAPAVAEADEVWRPGPQQWHGQGRHAPTLTQPTQEKSGQPVAHQSRWRSGRIFAHSRDILRQQRASQRLLHGMSERARDLVLKRMKELGELQAQVAYAPLPGVTTSNALALNVQQNAITGQVLKLNGQPLAHVTLRMAGQTTRTSSQGEFLLAGVPVGAQILVIDGRSADTRHKHYGRFEYRLEVMPGINDLDFTIWMPVLDTRNAVRIPSPTTSEVVLSHPDIPGLEVHIPAGAVIRDAEGKIVTEISLTPIPIDQTPFPVPGFHIPVYFTVQPGGAHIETTRPAGFNGGRIFYPNYHDEQPGARATFWNYDPGSKGWYAYGTGVVTADGSQVVPDPGVVVYEFTGAMFNASDTPAADAPKVCSGGIDIDGDPVSCHSGLFLEVNNDLSLPDALALPLTRTYRQNDANTRSFGVGTSHPYSMFLWSANQYQEVDLILPDSARVHFVRTSPGSSYSDAVFEHRSSSSAFYGSTISWRGSGWSLKMKDGTVFDFPQYAPLASITDRSGNKITIMRAGNSTSGNITRLVSPHGRWMEFTYDTGNRVKTAIDNIGRVVQYDYDADGRLIKVTDPQGGITAYTYDTSHRMLTVKDPRLKVKVSNQYDSNGRVIKQTYADNTINTFAYTLDTNGKVIQTTVTHERGDVRRITYNANGYPLTDTYALGKPEQQIITYERNADNLVTKMTDPLGRVTVYQYDAKGNVTRVTRLFGTANAISWSYAYEASYNQLRSATDPLNRTMTLTYDGQGNLLQARDPLANKTTFTYDALGRRLTASQYVGTAPLTTTFTYDGPDLVQVKDPLNRIVTLTPDPVGRLLSVRDPLGRLSRFTYDVLDRVTVSSDPQGNTMRSAYDGNGNLLSFTDPQNRVTQFTYDARNRLASKTDALGKTESYRYDPAGNLLFITDRKGQVSGFNYDALQRRIKSSYGATSTATPVYTSSTTYLYDAGNRLIKVQDSLAGDITRTYDPRLDTLTKEVSPEGTVNYTYYANGLRQTMTPTGGTAISYTYDAANRLIQITQAAGTGGGAIPGTAQTVTMDYDTAKRPASLMLPNGIQVTYGYDAASQLTGITYKKADATVIGDLTYTYDAAGQRVAIGGSLARSGLPKPFGVAQYDANNRLTKLDAVSYTYDNNGNLLSDGANTYTWNARDQLVAVSGANTMTYTYDGLGRRRKGTSSTLYDGWNPIQLKNGTTVVENRLTGLGLDAYFARVRGGAVQSYVTDALGSTLELRDAAQNAVASYAYDPYGGTSGPPDTNLVKYTGREQDFSDLYYYRNRYYKPSIGRFISEDPIGLVGGGNVYAYVGESPINYVDPLGLAACEVLFPDYPIEYSQGKTSTLLGGHGGVLGYDSAGATRYYEYGRYPPNAKGVIGKGLPTAQGNIRRLGVPDLEIGPDGKPTPKSLSNLESALSKASGKNTKVKMSCEPDADEEKVYKYVEEIAKNPKRSPYSWNPLMPNHCRSFANDAVDAGR